MSYVGEFANWDSTVLRWLLIISLIYILISSKGLDEQENTNKELGFQLELLAYNVILPYK